MSDSNRHNHRRHHDRDRVTREYDRPKHDHPNDRPFSRRNYDHRQHDNERNPIHTVFLFNLDFNTTIDQLKDFASEYGEIAPNLFYQPPKKKGMVFITYYDIRNAIRMVDEGRGRILNGKSIKTAYAYQPPTYSKRDPRDICSSTIYESTSNDIDFTTDDVKSVAEKVGEIRSLTEISKGKFDVVYFDLRSSKAAVEKKEVEINGIKFKVDYNLEEGIGDSPVFNEVSKPKTYNRDKNSSKSEKNYSKSHGESKRSKSPTEQDSSNSSSLLQFPPGSTAAYAIPYQYTFGYPYAFGYQYPVASRNPTVPVSVPQVPVQPINSATLSHPAAFTGLQPQYPTSHPLTTTGASLSLNPSVPTPPLPATTFPGSIPPMPLQNVNPTTPSSYSSSSLHQYYQQPPEIPPPPPLHQTSLTQAANTTSSLLSSTASIKPPPSIKPTAIDFRSSFDVDIFSDNPINPFAKENESNPNTSTTTGTYQPPVSSQLFSQQSGSIAPAEPIPMQDTLLSSNFAQSSNQSSNGKDSALEKMLAILS